MSLAGGATRVLYVDRDGLVRAGTLISEAGPGGEGVPVLTARGGRPLGPADVLALLEPRAATEDHRAALTRAAEAGYRMEAI